MASNNQNYISQSDHVDIIALFKTLWQRRKVFYWVWPITFVLSAALILCVPRYYKCTVHLAPEAQSSGAASSLQALASSFGFNMNSLSSSDAIYPMIYPDIVSSPDFLVKLFDVPVETFDGDFQGTYLQYLQNKHKKVFWSKWKSNIKSLFSSKDTLSTVGRDTTEGFNVFFMTNKQWEAIYMMQGNIRCAYNKKTQILSFSVTAQDRLVCAIMADSVCAALQSFVIDYRTQKARTDILYYDEVMNNAYSEYQEASNKYIRYVDSHSGVNLEQYRIVAKNLETEMQIKQAAYTSFQKQYLATQARMQENTPVYTVLQSASIPPRPAGPKRTVFVLAMLFLATCAAACVVCKDQLKEIFF